MSNLIPKHGGYRKLKGFQVAQLAYDITVRFVEKYVDRFSRTKDQMVQAARSGVQNIAEGSQASATSKKTELKLTQVARASLEELRLDYEDFLRQKSMPLLEPGDPVLMRFKKKRPQSMDEFRRWVKFECDLQAGRESKDAHGHAGTGEVRPDVSRTDTDNSRTDTDNSRTDTDNSRTDTDNSRTDTDNSRTDTDNSRTHTDNHELSQTNTDGKSNGGAVSERPCQSLPSTSSLPVRERPCKPPLPPECFVANGTLSLLNLACWFLDRQVEKLATDFENEGGFTERLYKVRSEKRRNNR